MRRVGEKSLLRFHGGAQAHDQAVHAFDQGRHFDRNSGEGNGCGRHRASIRNIPRQSVQPSKHPVQRPTDDEPGQRYDDQNGRRGPHGGTSGKFLTNRVALRDLHGPGVVVRRIDPPGLACDDDIFKAGLPRPRDFDAAKRGVGNDAALPDRYRNLIFRILIAGRRRVSIGKTQAGVECNLA